MLYICADTIKESLKGYKPEISERFHSQSAKIADQYFYKSLSETSINTVILLCGGTASGKTEYAKSVFGNSNAIVFDSTLSTILGAKIKINAVLKKNKLLKIYFVIPENLTNSYYAFLGRKRKFGIQHFINTHHGSRETMMYVIQKYPEIEINIIESYYDKDNNTHFNKLKFKNQTKLLEYISNIQLEIETIQKSII